MARTDIIGAFCLAALLVVGLVLVPPLTVVPTQARAAEAACVAPTQVLASPEETAWKIFIAATCPVNQKKYPYVKWETWLEQTQLYQSPSVPFSLMTNRKFPRFHRSPLAQFLQEQKKKERGEFHKLLLVNPDQGCGQATGSARTICEETRVNPDAANYIVSNGLVTMAGQKTLASAGRDFVFTRPSVEVKADWVLLSSCSNVPTDVHVENVDKSCYALAGLHLISKLIDKWIWATFEPQDTGTNPNRCVVLGCDDAWGSNPEMTNGKPTSPTSQLAQLMIAANIAPEWRNYRLDGVQVDFLDSSGNPTRLGNSIIEGENAGTPADMKASSCITCHARSTIATGSAPAPRPMFTVGSPAPLQAGVVSRDFVWSLSQAH